MGHYDLISRDFAAWRTEMQELLFMCAASGPGEQADRIREANQLFRMIPKALGNPLVALPDESVLESFLRAGANESAALALLGQETGFMVSRGSSGSIMATVVLPGRSEDFTAKARTVALALVEAQAGALLAETACDALSATNSEDECNTGAKPDKRPG